MKKILVVFSGGTFSMKIEEETGSAIPFFKGEQLLELIPEAKKLAKLSVYDFGMYPGPHMTPELMFSLAKKIKELITINEFDGVIVTHGTDTLEETAYLLDLTIKTEIPIVVIGAMKTSSEIDWDGPKNLMDAIKIINNQNSHGLGVLVCLSGEINAASEVTKTHTDDIETFHSLDFGALGFVDREKIFFNRAPRILETIDTNNINSNVDLIKACAGIDDKFVRFSVDTGVEGLIIEAMGVGNVPPKMFAGIEYAIEKGVPVVLTSRCPAGETLDIYGYPGAGKWLKKAGVIFSHYLNGQKARIKLMLVLGLANKPDAIRRYF